MLCLRNNGCNLRNHNHCSWRCNLKHNKGEKCGKGDIIKSPYIFKSNLIETEKKNNQYLSEKISTNYGLSKELTQYLSTHINYNENERRWLHETFLSDKAITKEVSVQWIKTYLVISEKYRTIDTVIILFAELLFSHRHNYLLNNKKFIKTLEKKYMELFSNFSNYNFVEEFKKTFFKDVLIHVLKLTTN